MGVFLMGFGRDVDFHDTCAMSVFIDLKTGEIFWVYEDDGDASFEGGIKEAENKKNRKRTSGTPERYLEIPGYSHGDHHQMLQKFLESEWTDDKKLWQKAKNAYFGSIGGWKKEVNDDSIVYTFYSYKDSVMRKEAIKFLKDNGIEPIDEIQ